MKCTKCNKDVVLEGIECPLCGYCHKPVEHTVPPKATSVKVAPKVEAPKVSVTKKARR